MRRAKIVCTLGPAVGNAHKILQLTEAGMDVARLNMSHGDQSDHEQNYAWVREAGNKVGKAIAVLADLQGPKIRLGRFADGPVQLEAGSTFTITTDDILGDVNRCSTTYKGLPGDVSVGDEILIDDGRMRLRATAVTDTDVTCLVETSGPVSNNKGINLPGVMVSVPAMSEKDIDDLRFALRLGVDFIALSFVRSADDYYDVKKIMVEEGIMRPVIAKIEKPQAVDNLDGIMDAFDGVMVARGDLGVELPLEDVPIVQKLIVEKARRNAKPVIVATQMLESMISAPRPTRAEASDVANAVLDGADAVMLSGETSVGEYPIHTVTTMARIIESTEEHGLPRMAAFTWKAKTKSGIICRAAVRGRRGGQRPLRRRVHDQRRLGTTDDPLPLQGAGHRVHARPARTLAARAQLGHRDVPRPRGHPHRRDGAAGRQGAAGDRPLPRRAAGRHRRREPSGHPRLDQRAAHPQHG